MEKVLRYKKIIALVFLFFITVFFIIFIVNKFYSNSFENIKTNERNIQNIKLFMTYYDQSGNIYKNNSKLNLSKNIPKNIYNNCNPQISYLDPLIYGIELNEITLPDKPNEKEQCIEFEKISLARTVPAITINFVNGSEFYDWIYENPDFLKISSSEVFKGFMSNYDHLTNITGLEVGDEFLKKPFLKYIFEDIFKSNPIIHFDSIRGKNGIVLEFDTEKADKANKLLASITKNFSNRVYTFEGLNEKIWEIQLTTQKFYLSPIKNKMYIASNLLSLINTMENESDQSIDKSHEEASVLVTLKLESYFDKLLPVLIGKNNYQPKFSFKLNKKHTKPLNAFFEQSKFFDIFTPNISDGVLKSIPHDVFFSIVSSISLPNPINTSQVIQNNSLNSEIFKLGKEKGGVAFIWDLNSEKNMNISSVGIAIENNPIKEINGFRIEELVNESEYFSKYCKNEKIFLLATNQNLLEKMLSSCEAQNKSILSWKNKEVAEFINSQLIFSVNLKSLFKTAFINTSKNIFTNNDSEKLKNNSPDWKKKSIDEIETMKIKTLETLNLLPTFGFYGSIGKNELNGFSLINEDY